jgi:ATP-binding cassette subfamily E protein 1
VSEFNNSLFVQLICIESCIDNMYSLSSYVIVVEHDLSVLDYLSDFICCLYGKPGAYGVVTLPFSVREGINIFLAGFVPTENLRFRDESLTFKVFQVLTQISAYM